MSALRRLLPGSFKSVLLLGWFLWGQAAGQILDNKYWTPNSNLHGMEEDENYIYLGGAFNYVGPNRSFGVKLSSTSAVPDNNFPAVKGTIYAVEPDGQGGWYIGGDFIKVGSLERKYIARVAGDGTIYNFSLALDGPVRAIHLNANGLYVGGNFTYLNNELCYGMIKVNPVTGEWDSNIPARVTGQIFSITSNNNRLYVGGGVTGFRDSAKSYNQLYIGKINETTGKFDTTWRPTLGFIVYGMDADTGGVYIGGDFQSVNGQPIKFFTKLGHQSAAPVPEFNATVDLSVTTVKVQGAKVYIGGSFLDINGSSSSPRLARLNSTTGQPDAGWGSNLGIGVKTISLSGGYIYAGGTMASTGGNIIRINESNGQKDQSWSLLAGGDVLAIAQSGGNIFAGGDFSSIGGIFQSNLCRVSKTTGILDTNFRPVVSGGIYRLYLEGDDLYLFGEITKVNNIVRNKVAKINKNTGVLDPNFNPDVTGPGSPVTAVRDIYVTPTAFYLAGSFNSVSGQSRLNLAKISKATGELDQNWVPSANNIVYAITVSGNGLYIGGNFTQVNSQTKTRLAKLDTLSGALVSGWDASANSTVYDMVAADTSLYICGNFTTINSLLRNRAAKFGLTSGSLNTAFQPNINSTVYTIETDGANIYFGGQFTAINGQPSGLLGRVSKITGLLDNQNPTIMTGARVQQLLFRNDELMAAGIFGSFNGEVAQSFAKIKFETVPSVVTGQAGSITASTAALNGEINPNGVQSFGYFEYGTTTSFGSRTDTINVGTGTTTVPVSRQLSGLSAGTTYYYRLNAYSGSSERNGATQNFTTLLANAPVVTTLAADSITLNSARLRGTVNPSGSPASYYFTYFNGVQTYYTDTVSLNSGTAPVAVSKTITGLQSNVNYTVKLVAFNQGSTVQGNEVQFRTLSLTPSIVTGSAEPVYQTVAYISGTVNPMGSGVKVVADYGTSTGYGMISDTVDAGSGNSSNPVSVKLTSLTQGTLYHYRLRAIYPGGSVNGLDSVFTTRTNPVAVAPLGAGTYSNPRRITSVENLLWISQNSSTWSSYFLQVNDIDAAATKYWYDGAGFPTIGVPTTGRFGGIYAGQGYKIKNLYINRPENSTVGLMADISGIILGLNVVDAYVKGKSSVGILAGTLSGTIINCNTSGTVEGTTNSMGGLVGYNSSAGRISYSSSSANVYGDTISSVSVGGLVGTHYQGQITNSFATGNVTGFTRTGGLAGDQSNATLKNSYARGNVYAALSRAGGLIGLLSGSPTVSNTYSTGSVTAPSIYGGLVGIFSNPAAPVFVANFWDEESSGISTSAVGYPRSTLQMKTNSTFIDSNWNWGVDWSREPNINDGYPYLVQMPPILPTIVTNGATSVGITTATLRATGKANAVQAWGYFDYGTTSNYGMRSDTVELGWAMFNVAVTRNLTGLQPNTQYHYRFVAYNADTIAYGLDSMFTTMPAPAPFAATVRADNITSTSARLNGVLNANGFATQYYFEYKTGSIVKRTDTLSAGSGTTNDTVRITVNGLSPFSIYTYKIIAFNSGASSSGADSSFATPAPPITPPPGTGTQADPYLISTLNHLYWLSMTPAAWVVGKYFEQIADIDASQTVDWDSGRGYLPIALNSIFYGRYDGKNHTIFGLNINRPTTDKIGLFSSTQSGSLSNITLTNVTISGFGLVGGLVGRNLSELTNCKTSGSVKGNGNYVGGLVGINSLGTIAYCSSSADVLNTSTLTSAGGIAGSIAFSTLKNSYATGNTKANFFSGGLVGNIESGVTIENCYARGRAEAVSGYAGGLGGNSPSPSSGSVIKNSYSTGLVIAPSNKGGLIPPSTVPHFISASFWDTETSGISTSGGGNGRTTAQMKTNSTFTDSGWNFTTVWQRVDSINNGYPYLLPPQVPAPVVITLKADNITPTGARLNGLVNANGLATQYYFEYKTGSTTKRTDTLSAGSGTTYDTVRISVSGLSPSSIYSHKIVAYNSGGSTSGGDSSFTTLSLPVPAVFTGSPINVMPKSATVSAKVNPNGLLTKAVFEYDTTTAYTKRSDTLTVGSGDTLVSISSLLNNLKPNTLYHYRVKAFNSSGTAFGADSVFTTPIQPKPFVQTLQADSVGIYSLRLRGKVNAMGDSTRYYFEYTVGSVVTRTDTIHIGSSFDTLTVTKYLTGLFPNSAYSYRIIAFNAAGSSQGSLLGSTTLMPPKPIVFTGSANPILQTSARLHGTINAQGDSTRWYFEYGLTTSYGMRSDTLYLGNSLNNVQVNKYILGLQPNTRYYYRVAAYNSAGLTNGAGTSFVTLAPVLALTSPVGGEGYEPGTTQFITWNASAVDTLKIEFSSDNGNTWSTVVDNQLTSGGSYNWMVPSVATTDGKIRITSKGITPEIVSMSTGVFTIAPSSLASQPTGTDQGLNGNSFPDNQNGSAVGDSGTVINTSNGGTTWVTPPAPIEGIGIRNLNDISTPSKWTRYAAGDSGTVYKTTNAGLSWNSLNTANMQSYYSIVFTDTLMGTIAGSNGTILKTTNGGSNWSVQTSGTSQALRDIYFTNAATATAVGDTGTILFTTNGGSTWTAQNSGTMQNLHGVWFVKNAGVHQIGYAVGDSGTIVKTTNGGTNWNVLLSPTSKKLNDIAFYTPERGSAVGDGGVVIYTTNGGSMWKSLVGTGSRNINSIAIPNSGGLMFLAGSNGSAFKDTVGIVPVELTSFTASNANGKVILNWVTASELNNAGFEVERAFTGASTPLSHRTPLSPSGEKVFTKIGELAGKGTTVQISEYTFIDNVSALGIYVYRLKQKDYDGTVSYSPEVEVTLDAPIEFALSQNYPNPFNPSTQIKYQLPEASDVLLEVYDIQGSLVSRLVSGKQEAGYYQVTFDAGKLSTGVYIYRLTAGKYTRTMKLMLMK